MISYPIAMDELHRQIDDALPTTQNKSGKFRRGRVKSWRERAEIEEKKVPIEGAFPHEAEPIWNELKPIFARIQGDGEKRVKCAYCERYLHMGKASLPDGDMDHFRPKSLYPLLAYHPRNYVLSCRLCNQTYKRNQFPIGGPRAVGTKYPDELDAELPDLVHPLDPKEPKLEQIVGFNGIIAASIADADSREERRANVMIDLFQINKRDDLRRERAETILEIYLAKVVDRNNTIAFEIAQSILQDRMNPLKAHFNCVQSYLELWQTDPVRASQLGEEADLFLQG